MNQARRRTRLALTLLIVAALCLAMTFFRFSASWSHALLNHVVVLDITQSMNTLDYSLAGKPVSRLQYAKSALRLALSALPCGSKIGWAVFTEYRSYLLLAPVEVCANFGDLARTLAQMDNRMAWAGASEIAKGLNSGLRTVKSLPDRPALVFITDGHEAPPIDPRHRVDMDVKPGEIRGLIVGVGGLVPLPIPKFDPDGNPLGFWRSDEVLHTDVYSQGRATSTPGERLVELTQPQNNAPKRDGREHLSALHEAYLQQLAAEAGMSYQRLQAEQDLVSALQTSALAYRGTARTELQWIPALLALVALLAPYLNWRASALRA